MRPRIFNQSAIMTSKSLLKLVAAGGTLGILITSGLYLTSSREAQFPAIEIVRALGLMPRSTDALAACTLVQKESFVAVTHVSKDPFAQLRGEPDSPFYACVSSFCAMPAPIDPVAAIIHEKYCGTPSDGVSLRSRGLRQLGVSHGMEAVKHDAAATGIF